LLWIGGSNLPGVLLIIITLAVAATYLVRGGFFSGGLDFGKLAISSDYKLFTAEDMRWHITYEKGKTTFAGLVRHASPIRDHTLRIVTHDILVTSGDFANPKLVNTHVSGHMFTTVVGSGINPKGKVNLLHTVPRSKEIYDELRRVRSGDHVAITGWEIYDVKAFDPGGQFRGKWQDMGCTTLLVASVEFRQSEE
jgi:hypothetical protein